MDKLHAAALVAIIAGVTIALRFAPFLLLRGRETPKFIAYLGRVKYLSRIVKITKLVIRLQRLQMVLVYVFQVKAKRNLELENLFQKNVLG